MLTIILKILSILGILILIILGVLVFLLLLVLFVPVTYSVRADRHMADGDGYIMHAAAKADWLAGLLRVRFLYPEPGTVTVKVLFFKVFDSGAESAGTGQETQRQENPEKEAQGQNVRNQDAGSWESSPGQTYTKEPAMGTGRERGTNTEDGTAKDSDSDTGDANAETAGPEDKPKQNFWEKLQYTFQEICGKIKKICFSIKKMLENVEYYKGVLLCEDTKGLVNHAFMRLGRILRSIRPRRLRADIRFGAETPDTTGYAVAVYGMVSPYLGRNVLLTPDFGQAVLEGDLYAAGHITVFKLLWHTLLLVLDKRLWELVSKLKEGQT